MRLIILVLMKIITRIVKKIIALTLTHAALFGVLYFTRPHSIPWLLSKVEVKDQFMNLTSEAP